MAWYNFGGNPQTKSVAGPTPAPTVDTSAIERALQEQTDTLREANARAEKAAADALAFQKEAQARAEAALVPLNDSESVRSARDIRQRALADSSPYGIGLSKKLGAPPTGFRVLSGS